jgi:hypothetical protein
VWGACACRQDTEPAATARFCPDSTVDGGVVKWPHARWQAGDHRVSGEAEQRVACCLGEG